MHSPEPWIVEVKENGGAASTYIIRHASAMAKDYQVAECYGEVCFNAKEDAERIVACVNACRGIDTEALKLAQSAALINDQQAGLQIVIACGPALQSRPSMVMGVLPRGPQP